MGSQMGSHRGVPRAAAAAAAASTEKPEEEQQPQPRAKPSTRKRDKAKLPPPAATPGAPTMLDPGLQQRGMTDVGTLEVEGEEEADWLEDIVVRAGGGRLPDNNVPMMMPSESIAAPPQQPQGIFGGTSIFRGIFSAKAKAATKAAHNAKVAPANPSASTTAPRNARGWRERGVARSQVENEFPNGIAQTKIDETNSGGDDAPSDSIMVSKEEETEGDYEEQNYTQNKETKIESETGQTEEDYDMKAYDEKEDDQKKPEPDPETKEQQAGPKLWRNQGDGDWLHGIGRGSQEPGMAIGGPTAASTAEQVSMALDMIMAAPTHAVVGPTGHAAPLWQAAGGAQPQELFPGLGMTDVEIATKGEYVKGMLMRVPAGDYPVVIARLQQQGTHAEFLGIEGNDAKVLVRFPVPGEEQQNQTDQEKEQQSTQADREKEQQSTQDGKGSGSSSSNAERTT
jgi:hypothetical protein